MKKFLVVFTLVCIFAAGSLAGIVSEIEITQASSLSVDSDFVAGADTLSWSEGQIANIYPAVGPVKTFFVDITANFSGATVGVDGDGYAYASFTTGSFAINFYALTDPTKIASIGIIEGHIVTPYNEYEDQEPTSAEDSELYGSAVFRMDDFSLDDGVDTYSWIEGLNSLGGLVATTKPTTPANMDYFNDWSSDNTVVTIKADESGIPEPMTIALLGLGGLLIRRKK